MNYEPITIFRRRQPKLDQKIPEIPWQPVTQGLELLTRPLRAIVGGVSGLFPRAGGPQDPLSGFLIGAAGGKVLPGQPQPPGAEEVVPGSFAGEIQERFGELGRLDLGPFTVTGSMAAGLPLDIALDPLSYIGYGMGRLGKAADLIPKPRAPFRLGPGMRAGEMAVVSPGMQAGEPLTQTGRIMEAGIGMTPPTAQPSIIGRLADVPVVGKYIEPLVERISPRQFQGPMAEAVTQRAQRGEWINSQTPAFLAPLLKHPGLQSFLSRLRPFTPAKGARKGEDLGELLIQTDEKLMSLSKFNETPTLWSQVDENCQSFLRFYSQIKADGFKLLRKYGIELEPTDFLEGPLYDPRVTVKEFEELGQVLNNQRMIPAARGILKKRKYPTQLMGALAGEKYITHPVEKLSYFLRQVLRQVADEQFRKQITPLVSKAGKVPQAPKGLLSGALAGKAFSPENADILEKAFREVNPLVQTVKDASGLSRLMTATGDLANPFIQGIPWLVRDPIGFTKAIYRQFEYLRDPSKVSAYLAKPEIQELLRRMPYLVVANTEFYEAMPGVARAARGGVKGIPGTAVAAGGLENMLSRFQAAFDGVGNLQRTTMGLALVDMAEKYNRVDEITDYINKASGITSSIGLGLSETQRAIESGIFFFAPRYTRASLALVGDAIKGATSGSEASKTIGAMLASGFLWYSKTARAIGQEPQLDPTKASFLTFELEGARIGIGSVWVSLARALSRSMMYPNRMLTLEPDNPIFQFFRGRAAPPGSAFLDSVVYGETPIGEPLKTGVDWAKYVTTKFMPFALEGLLLENPELLRVDWEKMGPIAKPVGAEFQPQALYQAVPEFMGARTFPQNFYELLDSQSRKEFGMDFNNLDAFQQADIRYSKEMKKYPIPPGKRGDRLRIFDRIHTDINKELLAGVEKLRSGQWDPPDFRLFYQEIMQNRGKRLDELDRNTPSHRDKLALEAHGVRFNDLSFEQQVRIEDRYGLRRLTDEERVRQKYLRLLVGGTVIERMERNPFEDADIYFASLSRGHQKYIEDSEEASVKKYDPEVQPTLMEWRKDRKQLEPYWDIASKVMDTFRISGRLDKMTLAQRRQFKLTPLYKMATNEISKRRQYWRIAHPRLDRLLRKWGYVTKLMSERS